MMASDANHPARLRLALAFRTAGTVLLCATPLLGLGLLGASRADTNPRQSAGSGRTQRPVSPAVSPVSPRRAIPTTRPTIEMIRAGEATVSGAAIEQPVAQLASYRIPAGRVVAPARDAELMRTIASDEKHTPRPIAPPSAAPRTLMARARVVRMEVTAYCPCTKCCGPSAQGVTASGLPVSHNGGRFVAADTSVLPFGTKLVIPGYHAVGPVEVIDRGGAIKGKRLDVYYPTHAAALQWGRQWVDVTVVAE